MEIDGIVAVETGKIHIYTRICGAKKRPRMKSQSKEKKKRESVKVCVCVRGRQAANVPMQSYPIEIMKIQTAMCM